MRKHMEKELITNSMAHSYNMLGRIVKYSHDKHIYNRRESINNTSSFVSPKTDAKTAVGGSSHNVSRK
jgi:hypothetical protein